MYLRKGTKGKVLCYNVTQITSKVTLHFCIGVLGSVKKSVCVCVCVCVCEMEREREREKERERD